MIWLGIIAKGMYDRHLGHLLAENVNWVAAILFYLMFIGGILLFVVYPAIEKQSLQHAIVYGALFGIITYATYDLTNLATLKNWPVAIVYIDIAWGALLTALVSTAGYYIAKFVH